MKPLPQCPSLSTDSSTPARKTKTLLSLCLSCLSTRAAPYSHSQPPHVGPAQVKELLINGEGDFEEEEVRHQWPRALGLRERDVDRVLLQLAGKRKNDMLVQAIAHLRTKRLADCVKSLNNVVACSKVGGPPGLDASFACIKLHVSFGASRYMGHLVHPMPIPHQVDNEQGCGPRPMKCIVFLFIRCGSFPGCHGGMLHAPACDDACLQLASGPGVWLLRHCRQMRP